MGLDERHDAGASVNSGLTDHSRRSGEVAKASGFADLPPRFLVKISCFANGIPLRMAHSSRSPELRGRRRGILSPFGYIVIALGARRSWLFKGKWGANARWRCGGATPLCLRRAAMPKPSFRVAGLWFRGTEAFCAIARRDSPASPYAGRRLLRAEFAGSSARTGAIRQAHVEAPSILQAASQFRDYQRPVGASGRDQCHNPQNLIFLP